MSTSYQTCFVLGSTSFAGSWFVAEALRRGMTVTGTSRSAEPHDIFLPYTWSDQAADAFEYHQLDLNKDTDAIIALIEDKAPEVIVDFAGQGMVAPSWQWPEQWYQTNVASKARIQNALRKMPFLKRYVRVSTPEVYGHTEGLIEESTDYNPSTPYAVSHAAIDMNVMAYYRQFDFPAILTRFANFYGPGQQLYRITPKALYCALTEETLPLHGGGTSVRAFIHARDVCNGIFAALEKGTPGEIYHFSTDEFVTIRELVEKIAEKAGKALSDFIEVTEDRPGKDTAYFMSADKAKKDLGWTPQYSLDSGVQDTYEWVHKNIDLIREMPKNYIHKK